MANYIFVLYLGGLRMSEEFSPECEKYAHEIDELLIKRDYNGLKAYLPGLKEFAAEHELFEYAPIFYYIGNIYGELANLLYKDGKGNQDEEIVEYRKLALFYFRKALDFFPDTSVNQFKLPLLTNYANDIDSCGRILEALRLYREALSINPCFAMALGNYGKALSALANIVNDGNHYLELHCYAFQAINRALELEDSNLYEDARTHFEKIADGYSEKVGILQECLQSDITFDTYDLGLGEEKQYREWCLKQHLFLTPLNDVIEQESAFAHDPLTITHFTEDIGHCDSVTGNKGEPPRWFAMINQLKEEYVYARYLCFASTQLSGGVHYADKNVKLSNGLDYSNYSIRLEQMKSAYKILYGMFDQIAYFINDFWKVGFSERRASANNVFKSEKYPMDNFALGALYWTYREFWDTYGDANAAYENDIVNLRNALEHKFVKIHEYSWHRGLTLENDNFYHLDETKFEKYTMRLLVLAREALMYLVYAIGINESKRDNNGRAVSLSIMDFDDDWKR